MKHNVLIRQMKKSGINLDSMDPNTRLFMKIIDEFYHAQDEDKARLSHLIETVTKENEVLIEDLKKQSAIAISESKMSVLGEMAAGIAHEINNPLMVLQTITSILEEQLEDGILNLEFALDQIKSADKTIGRISKIVQGLKTFSRDGKKDPFTDCTLGKLMDDTLCLCEEKLKKSKVVFTNNVDKDIKIKCRPSELEQVFLNMILNSRDAIDGQERKWITVDSVVTDEHVTIKITDSGTGIPLEIQDKLMNPFFTTKPIGVGTGLGLSISKGIIESHFGEISIDNSCPHTCFTMRFPIAC